jgi:hypothetical protein
MSGFNYNAPQKTITITSKPGTYFWSNGYAWGTCQVQGKTAVLKVLYGNMAVSQLVIAGVGSAKAKEMNLGKNEQYTFQIK